MAITPLLRPPRRFGELLDDAIALEFGNVVDEQHPVEVIDLVLDAGGEQALGILFMQVAVEIELFDFHPCRPFDVLVDIRDRQAALFVE